MQEVRGTGVVGEQPFLRPQESFEYTSGTAIATPVGTMRGSYQMRAEDGTSFDAADPRVHAQHAARAALSRTLRRARTGDRGAEFTALVGRSRVSSRLPRGSVHQTMQAEGREAEQDLECKPGHGRIRFQVR